MFADLLLKLSFLMPVALQQPSTDLSRQTVWVQEDPAAPLETPEQALEAFASGAAKGPSAKGPNLGFSKNRTWFLTKVQNLRSEDLYVLNFEFPGLDYINVYQVTPDGIKTLPQVGDRVSARQRSFAARTSNVKLVIPPQSDQWILYRVLTETGIQAGATLQTEAAFVERQADENALLWAVYGMVGIMAAYHIFIWAAMRQAVYGMYTFYLAFTLIAQMAISGHYMSVILIDRPDLSNTQVFWAAIAFIFLYEFTIRFLDLQNTGRKTYRTLRVLQLYILGSYSIWAFHSFFLWLKIATATQMIHPLALLIVGIMALKKGQKEARFFVLAFTVFMSGIFMFMAKQAGILPPSILIQFSIPVTSAIQITLMALALGDRMRLIEANAKRIEEEQKIADAQHKEEILKLNASLEQRVEEQTRDIKSMLENTKVGLFSVTQNLAIHKDYARYLESILETKEIAGRPFPEILLSKADIGSDEKHKIITSLEYSIGEEEMFYEANAANLPRECTIKVDPSGKKHLDLDWSPVLSKEGTVEKVLVSVRDVTETLRLRKQAEEQSRNLRYMAEVINLGPLRFERFEGAAKDAWNIIRSILTKAQGVQKVLTDEDLRQIYVQLHTIKGAARMLQLSELTNLIHEAEAVTAGKLPPKTLAWDALDEAMGAIEASQQSYRAAAEPLFNIRRELSAALRLKEMGPTLAALAQEAKGMFQEMAKVMQRPNCQFDISVPTDAKVPEVFYQAMLGSLIHIVRNSLDHGIEPPEERIAKGKTEAGKIRFWIDEAGRLAIGDDGRGLNLKKLEAKAKEVQFSYSTPEQLCELIFRSGVSTKETVDLISGRGVGMDAVRSFLRSAQSEIHVVKLQIEGDYMKFYFAIDLPSAYSDSLKKVS